MSNKTSHVERQLEEATKANYAFCVDVIKSFSQSEMICGYLSCQYVIDFVANAPFDAQATTYLSVSICDVTDTSSRPGETGHFGAHSKGTGADTFTPNTLIDNTCAIKPTAFQPTFSWIVNSDSSTSKTLAPLDPRCVSVEYQKRGIPHAHCIVPLKKGGPDGCASYFLAKL